MKNSYDFFRFFFVTAALLTVLLSGCNSGQGSPSASTTDHEPILIAGGHNFYLDNDRIYIGVPGVILSVKTDGGEITSHYAGLFSSVSGVEHVNNKIYYLDGVTGTNDIGLYSLPDSAIGITTFDGRSYYAADMATDDNYVYWSSGHKIFRTSRIYTVDSSTECIFTGSSEYGVVRFVKEGDMLFVADSNTKNIYKINLLNKEITTLATGISTDPTNEGAIALTLTSQALFATVNNRDIFKVNKDTGSYSRIVSSYLGLSDHDRVESAGNSLFWWEADGDVSLYLKRLDTLTNQLDTLVTIPYPMNLYTFYTDGIHVYWSTDDTSQTSGGRVQVWRVPVSGGASEMMASFPYYTSQISVIPRHMTSDADNLYWSSNYGLFKLPKSGGIPSVITRMIGSSPIVVGGSDLYMGNSEGISKMPVTGQTTEPVTLYMANESSTVWLGNLSHDSDNLYWTMSHGGDEVHNWGTFDVYSKPLAGGVAQKLTTLVDSVEDIFLYNEYVYILKETATGGGVSRIPKTGGPEEILATTPGWPTGIFVNNNNLYFTERMRAFAGGGLYRLDLTTKKLTLYDYGVLSGNELYVDGNHVYVTSSGGVYRMSIRDGSIDSMYQEDSCFNITGDANNIYWSTNSMLFKMAK